MGTGWLATNRPDPTVDDFFPQSYSPTGAIRAFMKDIPEMVPVRVPAWAGGETLEGTRSTAKHAAKRWGYRIRTITRDGELWVLRLSADAEYGPKVHPLLT